MRERMTEHRGGDEAHSSPPSQPAIKQIGVREVSRICQKINKLCLKAYLRETKVVENDVFKLFQNIAPFLITINSYGRITVPSVKLVEHPRGERRRV